MQPEEAPQQKKEEREPPTRRQVLAQLAGFGFFALGVGTGVCASQRSTKLSDLVDLEPNREAFSSFISSYAPTIIASSERAEIPAEMVGAVILEENLRRPRSQDWGDGYKRFQIRLGNRVNNPSLGIGQVKISTAMQLDGIDYREASRTDIRSYVALLEDPETNIDYVARYLGQLREHTSEVTGTDWSDEEILRIPAVFIRIADQYVRGAQAEPDPRGWYGREVLRNMIDYDVVELMGLRKENSVEAIHYVANVHLGRGWLNDED